MYKLYNIMTAEQEIDGQTLAGLTELMISHLLPTMKLQVKFMSMLNVLKTTSSAKQVQVTSVLSPYVSAANSDEWRVERVPSSPSLQNGCAMCIKAITFNIGFGINSFT